MVDGYYKSFGDWAWRAFLKRPRGDHNSKGDRCAWVLDASVPLACSKLLKKDVKDLYCPKHMRIWSSKK